MAKMSLNIRIDTELKAKLDQFARERYQTSTAVVIDAIVAKMAEDEARMRFAEK